MIKPSSFLRFFRFRLRTMLILVVLICVGLAAVINHHPAYQAERLTRLIKNVGGESYGEPRTTIEWYWRIWSKKTWEAPTGAALDGRAVTDDTLRRLANNSASQTLTLLDLSCSGISNAQMESLRKLPDLQHLDLSHTRIDDEGIAVLSSLPLHSLILNNTKVSNFGDAYFPGLTTLQLFDTQISSEGMRAIGRHTMIDDLNLEKTPLRDEDIQHLLRMSQLQNLNLSHTQISDAGIRMLSEKNFYYLWHVQLNGCNITDEGAGCLSTLLLKSLYDATLELESTSITDAGLEWLNDKQWRASTYGGPPPVRSLNVAHTKITDRLLTFFRIAELGSLDLSHTGISDQGMAHLAQSKYLYSLKMSGTQISDAGLAILGSPPGLDFLDLSHTQISNAGIAILAANKPQLGGLNLAGCQISDQCVKDLAKFNELGWLDLSGTSLTDEGIRDLSNRVGDQFGRLELHLAGTAISDASISSITHMHPAFLDLARTKITDEGVCQLRYAGDVLYHLTLSGCRITDRSLNFLCKCDTTKDSLVELYLANTDVTLDGLLGLRKIAGTLRVLDVSGLGLSESDLDALREALPKCEIMGAEPGMKSKYNW